MWLSRMSRPDEGYTRPPEALRIAMFGNENLVFRGMELIRLLPNPLIRLPKLGIFLRRCRSSFLTQRAAVVPENWSSIVIEKLFWNFAWMCPPAVSPAKR